MSLIHFEERSLSESVFLGSPEILHRRNVLYVPNIDGGADTAFGLYDENGRQILGNALFHGIPQSLKTQKVRAPFYHQLSDQKSIKRYMVDVFRIIMGISSLSASTPSGIIFFMGIRMIV